MTKDDANKVLRNLTQKYFLKETVGKPRFVDIFTLKGFTKAEMATLGQALLTISGQSGSNS
jgi:hypothetical protein